MRVSFGTRSPQALRFSARSEGGGSGLHTGHCFARPVVLRCARLARAAAPPVGSAQRVTDTRRGCEAAAVCFPAPHPCWLRREAQWLGWVRVPKDTRTSCSSLPMLSERSSKNAASSSAPPQARASQVAPVRPTGRTGDADWGSPFLGLPSLGERKRRWVRRRAHIPASALQPGKPHDSNGLDRRCMKSQLSPPSQPLHPADPPPPQTTAPSHAHAPAQWPATHWSCSSRAPPPRAPARSPR